MTKPSLRVDPHIQQWLRIRRQARRGETVTVRDVRWLVREVACLRREVQWKETVIDDLQYAAEYAE